MASGPEHYQQAELLLAAAKHETANPTTLTTSDLLAAAQVHADLAKAAATALAGRGYVSTDEQWWNVAATRSGGSA